MNTNTHPGTSHRRPRTIAAVLAAVLATGLLVAAVALLPFGGGGGTGHRSTDTPAAPVRTASNPNTCPPSAVTHPRGRWSGVGACGCPLTADAHEVWRRHGDPCGDGTALTCPRSADAAAAWTRRDVRCR